jgi:hypothetical protein
MLCHDMHKKNETEDTNDDSRTELDKNANMPVAQERKLIIDDLEEEVHVSRFTLH